MIQSYDDEYLTYISVYILGKTKTSWDYHQTQVIGT